MIKKSIPHAKFIAAISVMVTLGTSTAFGQTAPAVGDGGVPPFYAWSGQKGSLEHPGQLLRSEPLTQQQSLANAGQNLRLLYSSKDSTDGGTAIAVSGALFIPAGKPPAGGWPLMAWAHGTVGIADVCAPSFSGRSARDISYLNYWLAQGYAVVATDYQGLGTPGPHPYWNYRSTAYSVLDSIRAVQQADFHLSKKVVLIGQSQGGGATFAAAQYAHAYAPDLNIVGAVTTGTSVPEAASNMASSSNDDKETLAYMLLALNTAPLIDASFKPTDYLSDKALPVFEVGQSSCLHDLETKIVSTKLRGAEVFKKDPAPMVKALMSVRNYPNVKTSIPIFWGTGGKDTNSPTAGQRALVAQSCQLGSQIEWHLYPEFDHGATVNGSLPDSTGFVKRVFAGESVANNCPALMQ